VTRPSAINHSPPLPTVITKNLVKDYQLGDQLIHALNGINVVIPQGQFVAIMGPSGSGKSTLLYVLGGLDHPTSGEIEVADNRLEILTEDELARFRRETIGFIFQAFHLIPTLNALENVSLPGVFSFLPREMRERRAVKLLSILGMANRLDHRPSQLSGGQQQRVAIARALFNNPSIIMADEPTGALDSKTGNTVMRMLRWLCNKQGKTVIVVTHDSNVANYSDRILMLKDGEVVEDQSLRITAPRPSPNGRHATEEMPTVEEEADYAE
jgi:putative ABC transport system ATP-binding protein